MSGERCHIIIEDLHKKMGLLNGQLKAVSHLALKDLDANAQDTLKFIEKLSDQVAAFSSAMACCDTQPAVVKE